MTRWAKAGSSQKHKRMPEDSTPWEELSKNIKRLKTNTNITQTEDSQLYKNVKKSLSEQTENENSSVAETLASEQQLKEPKVRKKKKQKLYINGKKINVHHKKDIGMPEDSSKKEISKKIERNRTEDFSLCEDEKQRYREQSEVENFHVKDEFSLQHAKKSKLKKRKKSKNSLAVKEMDACVQEKVKHVEPLKNSITEEEANFINHSSLKPSKKQNRKCEDPKFNSKNILDEFNTTAINSAAQKLSGENKKSISENHRLRKKEIFRQKLKEKRKKLGIMLLPQTTENRLYRIKKRLREKGFPPEKIKEIIREERKKAQNEYRKTIVTKTCFNCRQSGHVLADCPQLSNLNNQETGICFKCGSTEHISATCKKKVTGFPFASCFICRKQGHISRNCPNNKHGIYPKGGKCNLCDSIDHLRKDCPILKKKSEEETSFQLHTIDEGKSIDDEIINIQDTKQKQKIKKPKVVAF